MESVVEIAVSAGGVMEESVSSASGSPRLRSPDRLQQYLVPTRLDDLVPSDDEVRVVWEVVERLDLSAFYAPLKARGSDPGRSATDPKLLVALWLYATLNNVGSARELERLCSVHNAYRWLCGSVPVNHHSLSDFRTGHEQALDALFTQVVARLVRAKLVSVERISQDGTRVRASAGAASFRREPRLEELLARARAHVSRLKEQLAAPVAAACSKARQAAQERAARERVMRIEQALAQMPEQKAARAKLSKKVAAARNKELRASTTDAEARVMKMPNGGFNPAYNVQLASDPSSRAIVGVSVTNAGTDSGQAEPMRLQVEKRTGFKVKEQLLDGGYLRLEEIDQAPAAGVTLYVPPKPPRNARTRQSAYEPRRADSPAQAAWRIRMGSEAGKRIYALRAATSETVNADLKTYRGLSRLLVRGMRKVRCVALWSALAYNLLHFTSAWVT
jgi:transposase